MDGLRHFRAASEILWANGGWKECWAASPEAALAEFLGRGWSGGMAHLQECRNGFWGNVHCPGHNGARYRGFGYEYLWRWH